MPARVQRHRVQYARRECALRAAMTEEAHAITALYPADAAKK